MSRKRKNEPNKVLTDIRIEKAAAEGNSLAHVDGKVLFVSYSAPGDLADVEVVRQKSGYMQSDAVVRPIFLPYFYHGTNQDLPPMSH